MKPNSAKNADRDGIIIRRRLLGDTLISIGYSLGLTKERVRQIILKRKPALSPQDQEELERLEMPQLKRVKQARIQQTKIRLTTKANLKSYLSAGKLCPIEVSQILGVEVPQDKMALATWLYGKFRLCRLGEYLRCGSCKKIKPVADYHPSAYRPVKPHGATCRPCASAQHNALYKTSSNIRTYQRQWVENNRVKVRGYVRRYQAKKRLEKLS